MFHGHADSVEEHEYNDEPIEPLLLDCVANFEPARKVGSRRPQITINQCRSGLSDVSVGWATYLNRFSALQNRLQAPLFFTLDFR